MAAVDGVLVETLTRSNRLVAEVADYLLQAGGKRLRPTLVLLSSRFGPRPQARAVRLVAAAVEMIHMATLVHDDIIDEATVRRGQAAVRQRFGNSVAVLAGDYLFARAFQLLAETSEPAIVGTAADIVYVMCSGEIAQNLALFQEVGEEEYRRRIEEKTAYFLGASCALGALAAGADPERVAALREYGRHLGMAFQVVDDVLDWRADPGRLGKPVGGDIQGGVYTLPLLYALQRQPWQAQLRQWLSSRPIPVEAVRALLEESGALEAAMRYARREADQAASLARGLPDLPERQALEELAHFVVERDH